MTVKSPEKDDILYIDDKPESLQPSKGYQVVQIDNVQVLGLDPEDADFYINFSEERRKAVIHKVCSILVCPTARPLHAVTIRCCTDH